MRFNVPSPCRPVTAVAATAVAVQRQEEEEMRVPFKAAVAVPMAAVAAAGLVAFSASPASADSHGTVIEQRKILGCRLDLSINRSTSWAYAHTWPVLPDWTCPGYVKNNHGTTSKTPPGNGGWSGGVWDGNGYKAWACMSAYNNGHFYNSVCTNSH
jgi:hypothetical protein